MLFNKENKKAIYAVLISIGANGLYDLLLWLVQHVRIVII